METRKIALACFVGGILCAGIALMVNPQLWIIGALAGMAAGYLFYDLREVLAAIPRAWRTAYREAPEFCHQVIGVGGVVLSEIWDWLKKPHPFLYFGVVLDYASFSSVVSPRLEWDSSRSADWWVAVPFLYTFYGVICCIGLYALAAAGAYFTEKSFWCPMWVLNPLDDPEVISRKTSKGFKEKPVTYLNVLRWQAEGLFLVIPAAAVIMLAGVCFFGVLRPLWLLFKYVHCHERVLCAIDGTLGGLLSLLLLRSYVASALDTTLVMIFGGLLGVVFGVVNYELVSKCLLHWQPVRS